MSSINTPVLVLLSRSIRLISMLRAAAGSQAPLARTLPPPSSSMRMSFPSPIRGSLGSSSSSGSSRSKGLSFSSSPAGSGWASAAGRGGRGGSTSSSSSSSFSASASSSSSSSFSAAAPRPPPEGTLITSPSNPFVKYCAKLRTSPSERSEAGATLLSGSTIISEVCGGGKGGGGGPAGSSAGGGGRRREAGGGGAEEDEDEQRGPLLAPRVLFLAPDAEAPAGVPRALLTLRAPAEVLARLAGLATTAPGKCTSLEAVAVVDLPREADFFLPLPPPPSQGSAAASAATTTPLRPPLRRLLALDGVQDPGNVGTLARSALALGWDGLYCLPGTADPWGDKSTRAARGAAWRLPVRAKGGSWGELLEVARASGLDFMVAQPREEEEEQEEEQEEAEQEEEREAGERRPPPRIDAPGGAAGVRRGVCLVLGSEGSGLSAEGRAALASLGGSSSSSSSSKRRENPPSSGSGSSSRGVGVTSVSIPMSGEMESLNVATAGAVLMFALSEGAGEFVRGLEK